MMNAKVVTKDKNKAMLLVDGNKQLGMTQTFSVFFKHLFVVIVISTISQVNTTMHNVHFGYYNGPVVKS